MDMPIPVASSHIWLDDSGRAWIDGSGYKVSILAEQHIVWGWNAEALHAAHPDLSLAQIHAALAFFYDHREDYEQQFDQGMDRIAELRRETGRSDLQLRLAELKQVP